MKYVNKSVNIPYLSLFVHMILKSHLRRKDAAREADAAVGRFHWVALLLAMSKYRVLLSKS
jgi:hypothetical protein